MKINNKDLFNLSKRWIYGSQLSWNYEKMMASGYVYSTLPILKKLYGNDVEKYKEMLKTHNQFFNTTPHMGGFILGIDVATEEMEGFNAKDTISSIKTGLMGSFAGIGDTIFGVLFPTVFGSIASYLALSGNAIGVVIWVLVNICIAIFRYYSVHIGYKQGKKIVLGVSGKLSALTSAATLLGITVIGAMIPSVINANINYVFISGDVNLNIQNTLDSIMPKMIPALLVALIYYLLGKKYLNSTKIIFLVVILGIVLRVLGIM